MSNEASTSITKKCHYCQTDIPLSAKKCPQCQSDLRSWPMRHKLVSILILLIMSPIVIAAVISGSQPYTPATTEQSSTPSGMEINTIAQGYVEKLLKAPSTAKFPVSRDYVDLGNNQYKVQSYVDSQNGFGAQIRSGYTVTLTYLGGTWADNNNWVIDEIVIDGEKVYPTK